MDPDPWDWSVQDVQQFFRNGATDYISDMPHSRLPQVDPFLKALNDNDVTGAILLTTVDSSTLRDDCGVSSLGVRGAVIHCIVKLRRQSAKYVAQHDHLRLDTPSSLPNRTLPPVPEHNELVAPSIEHAGDHVRSAEIQVQDAQGRKRRKLDLSKLDAPKEVEQNLAQISTAPVVPGYLGDSKFPIDELFYGQTDFGHEVNDLQPIGKVLEEDAEMGSHEEEPTFQFTFQAKPLGAAEYVHAQMRHFLSSTDVVETSREDRGALAILPYRDAYAKKGRSATVLQFKAGHAEPVALRENAAYLTTRGTEVEPTQQSAGEWDFLIQKYKSGKGDEDPILPLGGESETGDTEMLEETADGNDEDEAIEESESGNLSTERAGNVIDGAVQRIIADWHLKLPQLEEKKAWSVWKQTKRSRTLRDAFIGSAEAKIEHFTARIQAMKVEMLRSEWRDEQILSQKCEALGPTVEDREEQRWKIDVWKRRQEPDHAVKHGSGVKRPAPDASMGRSKGERSLVIPEADHFSVSPAPEGRTQPGIDPTEEIFYEADDEFHTPNNSPGPSPEVFAGSPEPPNDEIVDRSAADDSDYVDEEVDTELSFPSTTNHITPKKRSSVDDEASSSDPLPSPSTFVPRRTRTPASKATSTSKIMPIDLTLSSDSSTPKKSFSSSPSKKQVAPKPALKKTPSLQGDPFSVSAADVDSWDLSDLAKSNDRTRLMIKLLRELGHKVRMCLDSHLREVKREGFVSDLHTTILDMKDGKPRTLHLEENTAEALTQAAKMYITWLFPSLHSQDTKIMNSEDWKTVFDKNQSMNFTGLLASALSKKESKLFMDPKPRSSKPGSSSAPVPISSDGENANKKNTPHKKRKRDVRRSENAQNSREKALQRQIKFNESQTTDSTRLAAMVASDPSHSNIEINPAKAENEGYVYICDRIARKMKAHQIDGVRFLWREITADGVDGGQGCILAHTMGLGKTMQTIALLVAVDEASQSSEPSVYRQLPKHLRPKGLRGNRHLRALILCPPQLIQNWRKEISHWAPHLAHVWSLEASKTTPTHLSHLDDWMYVGGVLIAGYQKFRSMINGSKIQATEEEVVRIRKMLLEGPDIVVADEAHNLKNDASEIAKAASGFKTESRIGLTGTPMSNDVQEIFSVLSWAAPGYLGDQTEFKAHYTEPIVQGLYYDSTPYERRKSIMKLKVLHAEIQPKVNRANIEVLRGSLKPKIEFVLMVPLGAIQVGLYKRYIKALFNQDGSDNVSQVTIFGWLAVLTLLNNHPRCFRQKLLAPPPKRKHKDGVAKDNDSRQQSPSTESGSATPSHADEVTTAQEAADAEATKGKQFEQALGLTEDTVQEILGELKDDMDPALSSKVTIFLKLLEYSLECKDKVLVFSTSIPTLEYLDALLRQIGKGFGRIDGSTLVAKRMEALEDFHQGKFSIMLVSTKAGGVGLNIQDANRVFIFDFGFNPMLEEQAIGRAYRLGQTKPVFVYRFVADGTFEKAIYNKQLFKSSLSQRVVDKKNPRRNAERNNREMLHEPKEVRQENLAEWIGKDPKVLDRLLKQHGPEEEGKIDTRIRAVRTMETLQEEALDAPLDEQEQKEVNAEIELGRKRPRGRRANNTVNGIASPAPTAPAPAPASQPPRQMVSLSIPNASRPPASTIAGSSTTPQRPPAHPHGLPMPQPPNGY